VNVRGQFLGLRAAFRQFSVQRSPGPIAVTASIASLTAAADLLPYHVSKHAVVGLIRGAAAYGGPLGIRVNGVAPGIVPTELFASAAGAAGGKNDMEQRASTTPLRRAGTPDEIAAVAAFLLSEDAAYMTGQVVSADGGATIVNTVRPSGGAGAWDTRAVDDALYRESGNWSTNA
jgi:NAD(P)-dependent dehydrogenase (short-subunit alcohol dehydrogenase family)